jgi:hypothetical protein
MATAADQDLPSAQGRGEDLASLPSEHLRAELGRLIQEREKLLKACAREVERAQDKYEQCKAAKGEERRALEMQHGELQDVLALECASRTAELEAAEARLQEFEAREKSRREAAAALQHR